MTTTRVGTNIDSNSAGKSTSAITTVNVKDVVLLWVGVNTASITADSLSSARITWSKLGTWSAPSPMSFQQSLFMGIVNSVGSDTITATYSGAIGSTLVQWTGAQFHTDTGLDWVVDNAQIGSVSGGAPVTTMSLPALTSTGTGRLGVGMMIPRFSGTNGATSGWTYPTADGFTDVWPYNLNVGSGAWTPATAACTSGQYLSAGVILATVATGAATSATTTATTAAAVAWTPPVAAYSFDGTGTSVADDSGNAHGFTLANGNVRTVSGHTNAGVLGSGNGSAGTNIATGTPAWAQTSNRTVMLWMKAPDSVTEWAVRWNVVSINSGAWGFLINTTVVCCQARNASGFVRANATRPTDGLWHHYAATYDGTNVRMYLDGTLTDTQALTSPLRTDADTIDLAFLSNSTTTIVDDLRIFDSALSAGAIAALAATPVASGTLSGAATSATTTATTAAARLAGAASSQTTTATTAAARLAGAATSATVTAVTAVAALTAAASSATSTATTAAARLAGSAVSSTTTATTAAARLAGAVSSATVTAVTAAARLAAAATSTTTTGTVAAASTAGVTASATSTTTTGTVAAARRAGAATSATTTGVLAAARLAGAAVSTTSTATVAAAHDTVSHVPPGTWFAGTPVLAPQWSAGAPVLAPGWEPDHDGVTLTAPA